MFGAIQIKNEIKVVGKRMSIFYKIVRL